MAADPKDSWLTFFYSSPWSIPIVLYSKSVDSGTVCLLIRSILMHWETINLVKNCFLLWQICKCNLSFWEKKHGNSKDDIHLSITNLGKQALAEIVFIRCLVYLLFYDSVGCLIPKFIDFFYTHTRTSYNQVRNSSHQLAPSQHRLWGLKNSQQWFKFNCSF
jgi:hypothetical protein